MKKLKNFLKKPDNKFIFFFSTIIIFIFIIFIQNCLYIPPQKIKDDEFLDLEKEIIGIFSGYKFFFNKNHQLMGYSKSDRKCTLLQDFIECNEEYHLNNYKINKEFCYYFDSHQYEVWINYDPLCNNKIEKEKIRGGGFFVLSSDEEPLQKKIYPILYYFIRGEKNHIYYEEKNFEFFFFSIGKEITILEKISP